MDGRLSFHGMNPEIERIMQLEQEANCLKVAVKEKDVSDYEMANRYNTLVGTVNRRFSSKRDHRNLQECENEQRTKKFKFLKPSDD
jgi:M-phase phosphoprotein-6